MDYKLNNLGKFIAKEVGKEVAKTLAESAKDKLNVRSGNLSNVNNWDIKELGNTITVISNQKIPYANIQHTGGNIKITDKMRSAMWALYYKTHNELYKRIAITKKTYLNIKATSYANEIYNIDINSIQSIINYIKTI